MLVISVIEGGFCWHFQNTFPRAWAISQIVIVCRKRGSGMVRTELKRCCAYSRECERNPPATQVIQRFRNLPIFKTTLARTKIAAVQKKMRPVDDIRKHMREHYIVCRMKISQRISCTRLAQTNHANINKKSFSCVQTIERHPRIREMMSCKAARTLLAHTHSATNLISRLLLVGARTVHTWPLLVGYPWLRHFHVFS